MSDPQSGDPKRDARVIADRLILVSSLLLIVLTVIFSTFMSAEKFWQGEAIALHNIKLTETSLTDAARRELEAREKDYRDDDDAQVHYGQVFAGVLSLVMIITAFCIPVGIWHASPPYLRVITATLMAVSWADRSIRAWIRGWMH